MNPTQAETIWADALWALQALQVDGPGLGGAWVRVHHGPVRDQWLQAVGQAAPRTLKLPIHADDQALLGGIDLSATLQTSRLQWQTGLLAQAHGSWLQLQMAERAPRGLLAQLTQAMDRHRITDARGTLLPCRFALMALDESEPDEAVLHSSMGQRLGFWLNLDGLALQSTGQALTPLTLSEIQDIRACLLALRHEPGALRALIEVAEGLGIGDARALRFAWRTAQINAARRQGTQVSETDLTRAIGMTLLPRATRFPQTAEPPPESNEEHIEHPNHDDTPSDTQPSPHNQDLPPPDMLLAASLASLPADVLDRLMLQAQSQRSPSAQGHSGELRRNLQRGRPLPARAGRPGDQARLDVLATLRHAAPRQRLRGQPQADPGHVTPKRILLRGEDFHTKRYQQHSPTCLILALDASGSAAMQRLAQAKGAVELLLAQSYARRDSVCVIGFRGARAECLLPPTRSLVRAKRALAGLPGGGGTPLAHALQLALQQAKSLRREGQTPLLVVLSDGRANVTLQGLGGRQQAHSEAQAMAQRWAQSDQAALWIDTAPQPEALARQLAQSLNARYLPMPHVQSQRLAAAMDSQRSSR
jgi:magnesium chelatase subunit D